MAGDWRDVTLSALEAVTSFEVVDQLRTQRRLPPDRLTSVLTRSIVGILTLP